MAVINSSHFAYAMAPGIHKWWGLTYNEYKPEWPSIFETNPSSRAYEEEVGTTGFGLFGIKTEGGSISYDSQTQGYKKRYTHITYALGFIVTREAYKDDLYNVVARRESKGLAFSARQTEEWLHANVFNRAFTSGYTGADGSILCVSSHPNKTGGTWDNVASADLSELALEQGVIDISAWTTDRGLPIPFLVKRLIIPPALQFEATRILESQLQSDTAENNVNALRTMGVIPEVQILNRLSDAGAWFLQTDCPDGFKHFDREKITFGVDNDSDTHNAKYQAYFRMSTGWSDPKCVYGST